jgi:hypothetical protein
MPLKSWILQRMNRMNDVFGRSDLRRRTSRAGPTPGGIGTGPREPSLRGLPMFTSQGRRAPSIWGVRAADRGDPR